jgi:hypothetical protein
MTRAEREAFLSAVHVAVLSVAGVGDAAPIQTPVWYAYEPGGAIRITTSGTSPKGQQLQKLQRASVCVQSEVSPYAYVVVEGPVTISRPDFESDIRAIAERYLGQKGAAAYLGQSTDAGESSILVTLTPEKWHTVDYGKTFR